MACLPVSQERPGGIAPGAAVAVGAASASRADRERFPLAVLPLLLVPVNRFMVLLRGACGCPGGAGRVIPSGITAALPTLRGRKHRRASLSVHAPGGAPAP